MSTNCDRKISHPLGWMVAGMVAGGLWPWLAVPTIAQITPDTSLENNSVVTPNADIDGLPTDLIEQGTIQGANLFHSFTEFSIGAGQRVYFANPIGIENILSRVTGETGSSIDGLLGVAGNANLFFLNPNGITFGPSAELDISGSFLASTADSVTFEDGSGFNVVPSANELLTMSVPMGVQFNDPPQGSINSTGTLETGRDLALISNSLNLEGELRAGLDLTLQAQDTITIQQDIETGMFVARAGNDLTVQGNQGIEISTPQGLNETPFASGGNLSLISDAEIVGDAQFFSGGNFSIENLNGDPADFGSSVFPIIRAHGDVTFGGYEGVALRVEAIGSINIVGKVTITEPSSMPSSSNTDSSAIGDATIESENGDIDSAALTNQLGAVSSEAIAEFLSITEETGLDLNLDNGTAEEGSAIKSRFTLEDGETAQLQFDWEFFTNESIPSSFNDFAFVSIIGPESTITEIADTDPASPPVAQQPFSPSSSAFSSETSGSFISAELQSPGEYVIGVGVFDVNDTVIDSGINVKAPQLIRTIDGAPEEIPLPLFGETTVSDPDIGILESGAALILRAGVNPETFASAPDDLPTAAGESLPSDTVLQNPFTEQPLQPGSILIQGDLYTTGEDQSYVQDGYTAGTLILSAMGDVAVDGGLTTSAVGSVTDGSGGAVTIDAGGAVTLVDDVGFLASNPSSTGNGNGGEINIEGASVDLINYVIDPAAFEPDQTGNGGNVSIIANNGNVTLDGNVPFDGESGENGEIRGDTVSEDPDSRGGSISIEALEGNINLTDYTLDLRISGAGEGGSVSFEAGDRIVFNNSILNAANSGSGEGGSVSFDAGDLVSLNNSTLTTTNSGTGIPGNIGIMTGFTQVQEDANSGVVLKGSTISSATTADGAAGNITINTPQLTLGAGDLTNFSEVSATTMGNGQAGNVVLSTPQIVFVNFGEMPLPTLGNKISAATSGGGAGGNILFDVSGDTLSITGPGELSVGTSGTGAAGVFADVESFDNGESIIKIPNISIDQARLSASTSGSESGGNITLQSSELTLAGATIAVEATAAGGIAGDINIQTQVLDLTNSFITASNVDAATESNISIQGLSVLTAENTTIQADTESGVAGSISINSAVNEAPADNITLIGTTVIAEATKMGGTAGGVDIRTRTLTATSSEITASNVNAPEGGDINIDRLGSLSAEGTKIQANTESGVAGDITINDGDVAAGSISLSEQSLIAAEATEAEGSAGNVTIRTQVLEVTDSSVRASNIDAAEGGNININGLSTLFAEEAEIQASTESGVAGDITINGDVAAGSISLSEQSLIAAEATEAGGSAGNVTIRTQVLEVTDSSVRASNIDAAEGGNIELELGEIASVSGGDAKISASTISASTEGGTAGSISIETGTLVVDGGAAITVSSNPQGASGILDITATDSVALNNGFLTAETGAAGDADSAQITLNLTNSASLENILTLNDESFISATANGGEASGGNIDITADFIFAGFPTGDEGSDIFADAGQGDGGVVSITALSIFNTQFRLERTPFNDITASSNDGGLDGTVILNILDIDPSRGLTDLSLVLVDRSDQIVTGCGLNNSDRGSQFVITGRGGLSPTSSTVQSPNSVDVPWVTYDGESLSTPIAAPPTPAPDSNVLIEADRMQISPDGKTVEFLTDGIDTDVTQSGLLPTHQCSEESYDPFGEP